MILISQYSFTAYSQSASECRININALLQTVVLAILPTGLTLKIIFMQDNSQKCASSDFASLARSLLPRY